MFGQTWKKWKVFRQQICIFKFPPRWNSKFRPFFLDFSASTARLLDTFTMSDNLIRWGGVFWHNTYAELLLWSEFSEMIRFRTFLKKAAQIASEFAEEVWSFFQVSRPMGCEHGCTQNFLGPPVIFPSIRCSELQIVVELWNLVHKNNWRICDINKVK